MSIKLQEKKRISTIVSLIIAGEAIFFLPFVLARIFRPTLLDVFGISNTELGMYFSVYGLVALVSYVFGGTLADRFPARNLMSIALWLTALGGFVMAWIPSTGMMMVLYGFWGFTTIFLFWAAMIRATREWGGADFQGRAFGWLEGGRGGTAALLGTIAFVLFTWFMIDQGTGVATDGVDGTAANGAGSFHPFQIVILVISLITLLSGVLTWFMVPPGVIYSGSSPAEIMKRVLKLSRNPSIWMLAIIILCAYSGYKITDDFSLYAREVLGFSETGAAATGTGALWLRALVAVIAGYLADRLDKSKVLYWCFAVTLAGALLIGSGLPGRAAVLALLNLAFTATGIYGLRAIYFAVLREAGIGIALTGTAVGIMSFIGYTPEIFIGPLMGLLLDGFPGEAGHRYVFLVLAGFATIGMLTGILFSRQSGKLT